MPFHWKIDSKRQLMEIQAEGPLVLADCIQVVEVTAGAQCIPYRKLLDVRMATLEATHEEVMKLVVMLRDYHERYKVGPLAIVITSEQGSRYPQVLGALAAADLLP